MHTKNLKFSARSKLTHCLLTAVVQPDLRRILFSKCRNPQVFFWFSVFVTMKEFPVLFWAWNWVSLRIRWGSRRSNQKHTYCSICYQSTTHHPHVCTLRCLVLCARNSMDWEEEETLESRSTRDLSQTPVKAIYCPFLRAMREMKSSVFLWTPFHLFAFSISLFALFCHSLI